MKTGKQIQNKSWQGHVWEKWHVWPPYAKPLTHVHIKRGEPKPSALYLIQFPERLCGHRKKNINLGEPWNASWSNTQRPPMNAQKNPCIHTRTSRRPWCPHSVHTDFHLQSLTRVNHQDILRLLWITSSPEVQHFLAQQQRCIQSDYQQLKQAIIN